MKKLKGFDMINEKAKRKIFDIVYISLFTALIAVCSWITVPSVIPFTLQTFAIFTTVAMLGGKRGTLSVVCYILLGLCGVPVFANFNSGASALFGPTGGYIMGFILMALIMWGCEKFIGKKTSVLVISMFLGLIVCYLFGSLWYMFVFMNSTGASGFVAAMIKCVLPFIIPDTVKILLALLVKKRLGKYIK